MFDSKLPKITAILVLSVLVLPLAQNPSILADQSEVSELSSLNFKITGTYNGDPALFHFRYAEIGSDEESVRVDVSLEKTDENGGINGETVIYSSPAVPISGMASRVRNTRSNLSPVKRSPFSMWQLMSP
ncbi:MAG: hypothetical protein ACOCZX_02600 [Candidatus Bipolaricaulota bacterium]